MLKCMFSNEHAMMEMTPVENIFIAEYMPKAPDNSVKVYLYGLMLCRNPYMDAEDIQLALGLDEQAVIEAFFYWEKQGLIRVVGEDPVQVRYLTPRQHAVSSAPSPVMEYAEHVAALNSVFTARTLSSTELRHMLDWVEVFGMDKDAMAAVAEYCVAMKGQKVSVNYMDAVAKSWAEAGILTKERAMEHIKAMAERASGAQKLLNRWRISRKPTQDELNMYEKWTKGWGFDEESIQAACVEMTGAYKPSFNYLDAILESYRHSGAVSAAEVDEYLKKKDAAREAVRELTRLIFERAGIKRAPKSHEREQVDRWNGEWSLPAELLLYAADCAKNSSTPFAQVRRLASQWHEAGVLTLSAARERMEDADQSAKKDAKKKDTRALRYSQRSYSDDDLKHILVDFMDDDA